MLIFRDLKLIGTPEELKLVIEEIEKLLAKGWSRDKEKETELISRSGIDLVYCFVCSQTNERRACSLFLSKDKDDYLYVTNIVPRDVGELSSREYNLELTH